MCDENLCPVMMTFEIGRALVDELEDIHDSPDVSRGSIVAQRKAAEITRRCYPCDGPVHNRDDGMVQCPLVRLISDVTILATQPINRAGWAFAPEKLAGAETDKTTGQYL